MVKPSSSRFTPGKRPSIHSTGGWVGPGSVWTDAENLASLRIRSTVMLHLWYVFPHILYVNDRRVLAVILDVVRCYTISRHIQHEQNYLILTQHFWISHRHTNSGSVMKTESNNFLIMTQRCTSLCDDDTPSTRRFAQRLPYSFRKEQTPRFCVGQAYVIQSLKFYRIYLVSSYASCVGVIMLTPWSKALLKKMAISWYKS